MEKHDKFKLAAAYIDNNFGLIQSWIEVEKIARTQSEAQGIIVPPDTPAISFLGFWADQSGQIDQADFRPTKPFVITAKPDECQKPSPKYVS